jgi:uncharacterized membrane protein
MVFGIRGLDAFGLVHALIGIAALLLGLFVVTLRKGTSLHRKIGLSYVIAMVALNGTALWIYDLTGRFGPFHIAALVSLATLLAGYVPVLFRASFTDWVALHGTFMSWSYVGLVAAFLSEIAARVPGVGFSPAVIGATVVAVVGGAVLIHTRVPVRARQLAPSFIPQRHQRIDTGRSTGRNIAGQQSDKNR